MDIQAISAQFYDYSFYIRGYTKDTIRRYRYTVSFFCKHFDIKSAEDITLAKVQELFLYGRVERHWSVNTYLVFYKSLKVFFAWCMEHGFLAENIMEHIETPALEKALPHRLTKQDAVKLLEVVRNYPYSNIFLRHRNYAIFATFMFTGLRKSELLYLKLVDVDTENRTVFVRQGKGKKDRIIPIPATLAATLQQYLDERKRLKKTCPNFFTSMPKDTGLTAMGLKLLVEKIRLASKMQFTVHQLRHTFATMMLEGGCDIFSLAKLMGHSHIQTTTIYLAVSTELLRNQITKHPLNDMKIIKM